MPVRSSWAVVVGWLVVGAGIAAAAEVPGNRIANGEFDDLTTDPWAELFPEVSEFQVDTLFEADDCDNSKAARGINTSDADFGAAVYKICTTDVTAGETVNLTARVFFPTGVDDARVHFSVVPYTGTDCSGALTGMITPNAFSTDGKGVWYELELFEPLELPVGTQSVAVELFQTKIHGTDPVTDVVFDAVRLTSASWIWADGFEIGETCRWSVTVD